MKIKLLSKSLYKYLLSYCIVFIIPIISVLIFLNNYFFEIYKEEVFANIKAETKRFRDTVDSQIGQIYSSVHRMSFDENFNDLYNKDPYNRSKTARKLYEYSLTNDLISNIVFMQNNDEYVISSAGVSKNDTLSQYLFEYKDWPISLMTEEVFQYRHPHWRRFEDIKFYSDSTEQYMSLIYPLTKFGAANKKVFLIQIKEKNFFDIIHIDKDFDGEIYIIINGKGELLFSSFDEKDYFTEIYQAAMNDSTKVLNQFEGSGYVATYLKSDATDWIFINVLPTSIATQKVKNLQNIAMIFIILIVAFGALIIYLLTYLNYNPLKKLNMLIKNTAQSIPGGKSEIETATLLIHKLVQSENILRKKISASEESIRITMMYDLLRGDLRNIHELNMEGQDYGIEIKGNVFYLAAIFMKDTQKLIDGGSKFIQRIQDQSYCKIQMYGVEWMDKDTFVFLLSLDMMNDEQVKDILADIRKHILEEYSTDIIIGISKVFSEKDNVCQAYIEAVTAVEFSSSIPCQCRSNIFMYDHRELIHINEYPGAEIEKLKTAILDSDSDSFKTVSEYIFNYIEKGSISIFLTQCICYDVIIIIFKVFYMIDKDRSYQLQKYKLTDMSYNTIHKLIAITRSVCNDALKYISDKEVTLSDGQLKAIKKYIKNNFSSNDFSFYKLADVFDMSLSNISHYFKKSSGETLSQYLSRLRIEKAKELLRKTNLSINEIAEKTGYINPSSFIRRFKQMVKLTPGDYRNVHK